LADYSGSFSGSFEGNGSLLRNIDYYTLKNLPRTINTFEGNSILANNALRNNFTQNVKGRLNAEHVISSSAQLTNEFDIRYSNELNDGVVSGSSQITYNGISGIPSGIISSSAQISITESQISDLTHTDVSSLNVFSGSIQSQVDSLTSATSSYLTALPDIGIVSSSTQISDLGFLSSLPNGVISGSSQIEFDSISNVPSGLVSSSAQITITESQISDLVHTLIPDGTISGSEQIADVITDSYISASVAASGFGSGGVVDYNELENVPSNIISSSAQISALGYLTSQTDSQTLTITGNTLSISNGNSVILPTGGAGGGSSIWTTGSQDPVTYTHLMTSNNLQVTGSFDILGDLTVNGKSIFTQVSASDNESAVQINGRLELVEKQIGGYIASASIKIGNTKDVIDCGGFF